MKNIAAALIKAKTKFEAIHKNKLNPHFKSRYVSLDGILEVITEPLCEVGIVLIQPTIIRDGFTVLSTQLIHAESGESIESELIIPNQSDPQKLGSAMTYYRRFSICSLLAIAADDDDDGNTAVKNSTNTTTAFRSSPPSTAVSVLKPTQASYSTNAAQYQADLKKAFEILEWEPTRKAGWAKTINPAPFSGWSDSDWQLALARAYAEIDKMNETTSVKAVV